MKKKILMYKEGLFGKWKEYKENFLSYTMKETIEDRPIDKTWIIFYKVKEV